MSDRTSRPEGGAPAGLPARIAGLIAQAGGWLPFDVFMAEALYAPGLGYYSGGRRIFGHDPRGGSDFVTAPELSPFFARALAVQVRQALDATRTSEVIEFGAGSGALAFELLAALDAGAAEDAPPVRYAIVELSGALRERQRARLAAYGDRVRWLDAWPERIEGVVVGNEVLDAMPVTMLVRQDGAWHERGVALHPASTVEAPRFAFADRHEPVDPARVGRAAESLDEFRGPDGSVTEAHPQAEAFMASLAERITRGAAILVDYGFPEREYYHPQRTGGTLMCHQGHQADPDPLSDVGAKDITAHVNFTSVALAAQDAGLDVLGYTSQARFLLNCGLLDLLVAATTPERAMAQKLISEHEMGELFKVLVMAKGGEFDPVGCGEGDRTHTL